jgi:hypothetical protein
VLVHAHAPGHAVHDDADPSLRHAFRPGELTSSLHFRGRAAGASRIQMKRFNCSAS